MFNKNANAPDFVIGALILTPQELTTFCHENPDLMTEYNGQKQLRLQVLKSKEGNLYCSVDTYKQAASPATKSITDGQQAPDTGDLAF